MNEKGVGNESTWNLSEFGRFFLRIQLHVKGPSTFMTNAFGESVVGLYFWVAVKALCVWTYIVVEVAVEVFLG